MKHYIAAVAVLCLTVTASIAQEKKENNDKPSAAAEAAFRKTWPSATKVKWDKEGGDYEVNFMTGKKELSAVFSNTGALKESEEEIATSMLPTNATSYIKVHYKGAKIKEAAKITRANGEVNYEAEIHGADLIFDKDGNFLKVEKK